MYTLEMRFASAKKASSNFTLKWNVLESATAMLWVKLLIQLGKRKSPLFPRFSGFFNPHKTHEDICRKLNESIELINESLPYEIKERASGPFTQEFANIVHHHFELLRGSREKPAEIFKQTSMRVRFAILNLNHCIHDLEALSRATAAEKAASSSAAALMLEGWGIEGFKLPAEVYGEFSLDNDYADIVLHYAQIGKTWWEVFLDEDHDIFNEAILPLDVITGEFDVFFESFKLPEQQKENLHQFLKDRGLDPQDPSLRLGYLPVAKFVDELKLSKKKYNEMIATHDLQWAKIYKDGQEITALNLNPHMYDLNLDEMKTREPLVEVKNLGLTVSNHYYQPKSLKEVWISALSSPAKFYSERMRTLSILSDISFQLYEGDRVAVLGVNGSGKTTLCHCLSQFLKPTHGSVKINCDSRSIIQIDAGFYPELTGRENAELLSWFLYPKLSRRERDDLVRQTLIFSELDHHADMSVEKYSLGMKSRLAQALVSAQPMDFLILDEISGYVDEFYLKKIRSRLRALIANSKVSVIVSHNADELLELCNRGIVIDQGKLVFDGKVAQAVQAYRFLNGAALETLNAER